MPTLSVQFPGGVPINGGNSVTLSGDVGGTITLPFTDKVVPIGNLAPNWQQVPRPGFIEAPFLMRGPRNLRTLTLTVTIVNPQNTRGSVDDLLKNLTAMLQQSSSITVTYGSFESSSVVTESGQFVCTSFEPQIEMRDPATNEAIQATATIEFTEANPAPVIASPGPS